MRAVKGVVGTQCTVLVVKYGLYVDVKDLNTVRITRERTVKLVQTNIVARRVRIRAVLRDVQICTNVDYRTRLIFPYHTENLTVSLGRARDIVAALINAEHEINLTVLLCRKQLTEI